MLDLAISMAVLLALYGTCQHAFRRLEGTQFSQRRVALVGPVERLPRLRETTGMPTAGQERRFVRVLRDLRQAIRLGPRKTRGPDVVRGR